MPNVAGKASKHIETIYLQSQFVARRNALCNCRFSWPGHQWRAGRHHPAEHSKQTRRKAREGKRVVVLVDEAHAMPADTLEELRLLYNLQWAIPAAENRAVRTTGTGCQMDQPSMRQLKDRIVHHFDMQPLSRDILENYLMFRMRTAGYHGPNISHPPPSNDRQCL